MSLLHLVAVLLLLAVSEPSQAAPKGADLPRVERLIVEGTNSFRAQNGAERVARQAELDAAARTFAVFMAKTAKYGHEADGRTPAARAQAHGFDYCLVSENISYQFSSEDFGTDELARRLVEGWKKSPGHRKNMLDENVTHTGVAVARSPATGYYYAVHMFGRPKSASIEFQVRNASGSSVNYRVGERAFTLGPRAGRKHVQCSVEEILFELPGTATKLTANGGDRFEVAQTRGRLVARRLD